MAGQPGQTAQQLSVQDHGAVHLSLVDEEALW